MFAIDFLKIWIYKFFLDNARVWTCIKVAINIYIKLTPIYRTTNSLQAYPKKKLIKEKEIQRVWGCVLHKAKEIFFFVTRRQTTTKRKETRKEKANRTRNKTDC